MAKEIIMPKFGFTQEESEIQEWLKQEGEQVEKGDPIAVVSTDKISMEVEAPESGILSGIRYKVGDIVPVTNIIAYILQPGETAPADMGKKPIEEMKGSETKQQIKSTGAFSISPVAKRLIDDHQIDPNLIQGSGKDGLITRNDVEGYLAKQASAMGKIKATPAARRLAKENQVEIQSVSGSGPSGRIQVSDIQEVKATLPKVEPTAVESKVFKEIPLVGMRRTIAQNMQRSMQEAPHMVLQIDVEMDAAEGLRRIANESCIDPSQKISVTAVIVKAVAWALKRNPILNSTYTDKKIILFSDINIGIATALEDGLIVPVIHQTDKKNLSQISAELIDLTQRARDSKLKPEDLTDGTFTISNLGMYGIDRFSAIINPPQSAILAVGKMKRIFIPDEADQPVARSIITFSLSADHRVMDGSQAAMFLSDLQKSLQNLGEILK